MIPLDLLVAVVCITSPDVRPEAPPCPLLVLQAVAIQLEVLDPREAKWYFSVSTCFTGDLSEIQRRFIDTRDAPTILDTMRLPDEEYCRQMMECNRKYRNWLEQRALLFPREAWIGEALEQCAELWIVWDTARDAQMDYYIYTRRRALKLLREIIGPQMYYAGCLPSPVPVWSLRRSD